MAEPPSLDTLCTTGAYESSSVGSDNSFPFGAKVEGYDYEFVPVPDSRYECAICLLVLREPRQTPCGHRFCRDCILKWLREPHTRCPVDNEEILEQDLFPDNFAKREIQNFIVHCPNSKQGCQVLTTVKEVPTHQSVCPLALVPCPNRCTHVLLRRDLDNHMTQSCERRSLLCPHCQGSFLAIGYEEHVQSCPQASVPCQYCGEDIMKQEMSHHTQDTCLKAVVSCSFRMLGCPAQIVRADMESHLSESMVSHMNLLCQGITWLFQHLSIPPLPASASFSSSAKPDLNLPGLSAVEVGGAMASMAPVVHHMMTSLYSGGTVISSSREPQQVVSSSGWSLPPPKLSLHSSLRSPVSSSSLDSAITSSHHHTPSHSPSIQRSPSDPKSLLYAGVGGKEGRAVSYTSHGEDNCRGPVGAETGGRWGSMGGGGSSLQDEQKLVVHDQKLLELQLKLDNLDRNYRQKLKELNDLEGRICNGQFYWKIHNYSRYQREAEQGETTALHSQAFYTAPSGGYKLCVRANLNGVDAAKGSHLSLFIHFMQGEYDDVLEWPFSGRIVLEVMDQNERCELRNHVSETLSSKSNLAAFQRPTTPRNHKGFGYMEFLPLSTLSGSSYIHNDMLIIRVTVVPNG